MIKKIFITIFATGIMFLGVWFVLDLRKDKNVIEENTPILVGGDADEHGCLASAGYTWCQIKAKCLRPWEEKCEVGTLAKTYIYTDFTSKKTATVAMAADGKSVVLNYENIKNLILNSVISASGARYANQDESIVFWNKGDDGMVFINDKMVLNSAGPIPVLPEVTKYDKVSCEKASGVWFTDNNTCEINSYSKTQCEAKGGEFNECASACRHDPKAEVCTMQCVLTCSFK
jgi:membrane-bound inhibitor of C-type lysozyme